MTEKLLTDNPFPQAAVGAPLEGASDDGIDPLVRTLNDTAAPLSCLATIHGQFESVARRDPDRVAAVIDGQMLTYGALDRTSAHLAAELRSIGVEREGLVGIGMDRSLKLLIAILGVLKAGGAYLPLDPSYPRERLAYMVDDAGLRLVLAGPSEERIFADFKGLTTQVIDRNSSFLHDSSEPAPSLPTKGENLAYVIYTSGSTGRPKGIMVPHRALLNHVSWRSGEFGLTAEERFLQRTPTSFDISVWEIFAALLTGATLILPVPGAHKESVCLVDAIIENEVTSFQIVPSMLKLMLREPKMDRCASLRQVFSGGEVLSPSLKDDFHRLSGSNLTNVYGPTETAIDTTYWPCPRSASDGLLPIGRPVSNSTIFITDDDFRAQAPGQEGALMVGGRGLARGYWKNPRLTAQSFRPHPFAPSPNSGERLYATGDIGRISRQGQVEFLGRRDSQVKVRGFRIELGEIEAVLKRCPIVSDGIVTVRERRGDSKKIVAYYSLKQSGDTIVGNAIRHAHLNEIRAFMAERLPDYMVPHHFLNVDGIPLLPNGKVNIRALPEPAFYRSREDRKSIVAPSSEKEKILAAVWRQVLGVDEVSVDDLFPYYGGDSLQMVEIRLVAQQKGLYLHPSVTHYDATIRTMAENAVFLEDRKTARDLQSKDLWRYGQLALHARRYALLDVYRQLRTKRLEKPHFEGFARFYQGLADKRDIFYLFIRSGLLHWVSKQLEFVPEDVNLVLVGTALDRAELEWIAQNTSRPFHHIELEIDDNAIWEFLFEVNQYSFGWLEIGCFVNNSHLFHELTRLEPDVAFNCIFTHTERHRRTFLEYFIFVNVEGVKTLRDKGIEVYPSRYSYNGVVRSEHRNAYHRVPSSRDRALVTKLIREESGADYQGFRGQVLNQKVFELYFFIGHLFYLHLKEFGFRINRIRHLTAPTHLNYYNFFSDEVITALHLTRYEEIYRINGPKFHQDLDMTLQADYLLLLESLQRFPKNYRNRLRYLEMRIKGRNIELQDVSRNVLEYLTHYGVSRHVFDREPWRFIKG